MLTLSIGHKFPLYTSSAYRHIGIALFISLANNGNSKSGLESLIIICSDALTGDLHRSMTYIRIHNYTTRVQIWVWVGLYLLERRPTNPLEFAA